MDTATFNRELAARGYQAKIVDIGRAAELAAAIEDLHGRGFFTPDFYDKELAKFLDCNYTDKLPQAKSIVIVAAFQPPTRVRFGETLLTIPPTYVYRDIWEGSLTVVTELLQAEGFQARRARLPLKMLAVGSGLGKYGRNNICYIPGMGSCHRLGAFFTDLPCPKDSWQPLVMMELCQGCRLCRKACPTSAISDDRFLIDAGRCLTFFNEQEGAFPGWIQDKWHNAILGCLICQRVCPANWEALSKTQDSPLGFTGDETSAILGGTPLSVLSPETREKLHQLCLDDDYALTARNIGCLIKPQAEQR